MKRHTLIMVMLLAMLVPQAAPPQGAQGDPPASPEIQTDETPEVSSAEQARERVAALGLPGKHHEHLLGTTGDWSLTINIWRAPGAEPTISHGTAEGRALLGGRFVETVFRGEILGQPFEAQRVDGYDNQSEQYVSTWRDTMGTYTMLFKGKCEEEGQARTQTADFTEPISGQKLKIKGVTTMIDPESYTYESFIVTSAGTEFKNLELVAKKNAR